MKRRALLKRTAALAATGALAGCVGDDSLGGVDEETETKTDTPTGTPTAEPTPKLESQSIETTDTGCGSEGNASVSFGDAAVDVTGSVVASTPCHVAVMQDATFDTESKTLTVTVGVKEDGSDACMECIGVVEYAATLGFADGLPETVEVVHASQGKTTTVTTTSR
ncbi:hypothetical protein [Haloarchaeobius sp. HME9146]|uniref:hypothetical protein n=1 Tax=Haloarchaeobius sp. HME9146 TaxID=2978732 RepID=UPI0021C1C4AA|nr:hypothetical protein [Haloarchaeobius sp. HME9146]MCT9095261.1 hypothetical protein [Haloarchaeobius sp. HME9146]